MSVNEDAFDVLTRHRLYLLRYEAGTARALVAVYDAALADVLAEMRAFQGAETVDTARAARLLAVSRDLEAKIREAGRVAALTLEQRLAETAEAEADLHAGRLARTIGLSFTRVPEATVAAAVTTPIGGGRWTQRLAVDLVESHDLIRGAIAEGLASGGSMDRIARMIGEATGLAETYRNRLVAIARTEVQRVANDVALASYVENSDIIAGVEVVGTLDSRTCLVCAPLHGTVYPMQAGRPVGMTRRPPYHPRCRCFLAPVVKPYSELLGTPTRPPSAYTGRPALDTTYDAWLRRQSADLQEEVLGPARLAAWRAGAPLGAFTDNGRILGLGELRRRGTLDE